MSDSSTSNRSNIERSDPRHYGFGAWVVFAMLSALLVASGVISYFGWTSANISVPTSGYVALILGVVFSLVVGCGLMALVFFSSRKGYDEPAVLVQQSSPDQDEGTKDLATERHMIPVAVGATPSERPEAPAIGSPRLASVRTGNRNAQTSEGQTSAIVSPISKSHQRLRQASAERCSQHVYIAANRWTAGTGRVEPVVLFLWSCLSGKASRST